MSFYLLTYYVNLIFVLLPSILVGYVGTCYAFAAAKLRGRYTGDIPSAVTLDCFCAIACVGFESQTWLIAPHAR